MYSSSQINVEWEMGDFFKRLKIPSLSREDRGIGGTIDTRRTTKGNSRYGESDGLPIEIYNTYSNVLLPKLLEVLNWASGEGETTPVYDRSNNNCTTKGGEKTI